MGSKDIKTLEKDVKILELKKKKKELQKELKGEVTSKVKAPEGESKVGRNIVILIIIIGGLWFAVNFLMSQGISPTTPFEGWVLKVDDNGAAISGKTYGVGINSNQTAHSITQTTDGGYIVAGEIYGSASARI